MRWNFLPHQTSQPPAAKEHAITSYISSWLTPIVYWLGNHVLMPLYFRRVEIIGQEHLPHAGSVILAPTHRSRWDAIIIPFVAGRTVTGRDLRFMVAVNEVKGLQGWFIRHLGGFPIDPEHPAIASLRHSLELLTHGETLVIFPEGGELSDNRQVGVNQLHPGLARLALQAKTLHPSLETKVVPIAVQYYPPIPRWGCSVKVHIGEPLSVSPYLDHGLKKGAKQLTVDLEQSLQALSFSQMLGTRAPQSESPLDNTDLLCA